MKFEKSFLSNISKYGRSDLFNYKGQQAKHLKVWECTQSRLPSNGFEEMILLTEQGKLWKYPIDNEQGMDAEQQVPFEDHVFFEDQLTGFPKNDYIERFMELVTSGLARNPYMTVDRKREVIKFYRDYFEHHREHYKNAGLELA